MYFVFEDYELLGADILNILARIFQKKYLLGLLPFLVIFFGYMFLSFQRHVENPNDRLLPTLAQLYDAFRLSLVPSTSATNETIPFIQDTLYSMFRLIAALFISGFLSLTLALLLGNSEWFRDLFFPLLVTISKIPPVALLPILLLWMGLNEFSKIGLLVIGVLPGLSLHLSDDLAREKRQIEEKLLTLNLPVWQRFFYIDIPLIWPSFLHQMQASLGSAWLFLLVAETVGADFGLGYRIFVVRRYLAMDIILVYVIWITLLSILVYYLFSLWKRKFDWYFND